MARTALGDIKRIIKKELTTITGYRWQNENSCCPMNSLLFYKQVDINVLSHLRSYSHQGRITNVKEATFEN